MRFLRLSGRFARNKSGVAALEFAAVAPVLATVMLFTVDIGSMFIDRTDMQSAVRTGAQYLMNGGQDLDTARDLVLDAWVSKPPDGTVISERFCMCQDTVHICTSLCGDGSIPDSYIRLQALGKMEGILMDLSQGSKEVVRIR